MSALLSNCLYRLPQPNGFGVATSSAVLLAHIGRRRHVYEAAHLGLRRAVHSTLINSEHTMTDVNQVGSGPRRLPVDARQGATRPLEIVQIDESEVSLMAFLKEHNLWAKSSPEFRHAITHAQLYVSAALDTYSRAVLAVVVTAAPSVDRALTTVQMIMDDKTDRARSMGCSTPWSMFGVPDAILTDSGGSFRSAAFRSALLNHGVTALHAPAGLPSARSGIERFFRTANQQFLSVFAGQSFADGVAKADHVGADHVSLVIDDLTALYVRWVVDVYHNTGHPGLGGDTPLHVFREGVAKFGVTQRTCQE